MSPDQDHIDDLLADHAFGTLDLADDGRAARHLSHCARCTTLAESDRAVVAQLGFAAPRRQPPPHVRLRLIERVAREDVPSQRLLSRDVDAPHPTNAVPRRLPHQAPRWAFAAALLPWLVAAGLGAALVATRRAPSPPSPLPALAVVALNGPHGETGRLVMDPNGTSAFLALTHLPPVRHGMVYVCWLKHGGGMDMAGTFGVIPRSDDAFVHLHASRPMRGYTYAGITAESTVRPARPHLPFLAAGPLS